MNWRYPALIGLLSCNRDPEVIQRPIVVYSPASCPVRDDPASPRARTRWSTRAETSITRCRPRSTCATSARRCRPSRRRRVRSSSTSPPVTSRGAGSVTCPRAARTSSSGAARACPLTGNVQARTDMAFAVFGHRFMVVGGRSPSATSPYTFVRGSHDRRRRETALRSQAKPHSSDRDRLRRRSARGRGRERLRGAAEHGRGLLARARRLRAGGDRASQGACSTAQSSSGRADPARGRQGIATAAYSARWNRRSRHASRAPRAWRRFAVARHSPTVLRLAKRRGPRRGRLRR